jgi:hypothetical protein
MKYPSIIVPLSLLSTRTQFMKSFRAGAGQTRASGGFSDTVKSGPACAEMRADDQLLALPLARRTMIAGEAGNPIG